MAKRIEGGIAARFDSVWLLRWGMLCDNASNCVHQDALSSNFPIADEAHLQHEHAGAPPPLRLRRYCRLSFISGLCHSSSPSAAAT
jgi:hypothetical protein